MVKQEQHTFSYVYITMAFVTMLIILFVMCLSEGTTAGSAANTKNPPAIFVFGDSTVDVGTNSYVPYSQLRADFPFYGIDFPHSRPTGRFSNGFNGADFLARLMGYTSSPRPFFSFRTPLNAHLRHRAFRGASFASAGSGILDPTNSDQGVVSLSDQIRHFGELQRNLTQVHGLETTQQLLSKSLFSISTGSNDIFVYLQSKSTIPAPQFISLLINQYQYHIKALYSLGARKFGILGVAAIGCCPVMRISAGGECSEALNELARAFFTALEKLMSQIASQLPGMKYSLGNLYQMSINVVNNPAPFNFTNVDTACCGFGKLNAEHSCNGTANLCRNRDNFLFWDLFHPSQAASQLTAVTLYFGPTLFVSPINFSQLVHDS